MMMPRTGRKTTLALQVFELRLHSHTGRAHIRIPLPFIANIIPSTIHTIFTGIRHIHLSLKLRKEIPLADMIKLVLITLFLVMLLRQTFIRLNALPGVGHSGAPFSNVARLPVVADVGLGLGDLGFAGCGDVGIFAFEGGEEVGAADFVELAGVAVEFGVAGAGRA